MSRDHARAAGTPGLDRHAIVGLELGAYRAIRTVLRIEGEVRSPGVVDDVRTVVLQGPRELPAGLGLQPQCPDSSPMPGWPAALPFSSRYWSYCRSCHKTRPHSRPPLSPASGSNRHGSCTCRAPLSRTHSPSGRGAVLAAPDAVRLPGWSRRSPTGRSHRGSL